MNSFICKYEKDTWDGYVSMVKSYGTHYEFLIQSRSSIMVIFGETTRGYFACMPDFDVGCHLVSLNDAFWNTERLSKILGPIDGITVANALFCLKDLLMYPEF